MDSVSRGLGCRFRFSFRFRFMDSASRGRIQKSDAICHLEIRQHMASNDLEI
jgi:hypothetical protein